MRLNTVLARVAVALGIPAQSDPATVIQQAEITFNAAKTALVELNQTKQLLEKARQAQLSLRESLTHARAHANNAVEQASSNRDRKKRKSCARKLQNAIQREEQLRKECVELRRDGAKYAKCQQHVETLVAQNKIRILKEREAIAALLRESADNAEDHGLDAVTAVRNALNYAARRIERGEHAPRTEST